MTVIIPFLNEGIEVEKLLKVGEWTFGRLVIPAYFSVFMNPSINFFLLASFNPL